MKGRLLFFLKKKTTILVRETKEKLYLGSLGVRWRVDLVLRSIGESKKKRNVPCEAAPKIRFVLFCNDERGREETELLNKSERNTSTTSLVFSTRPFPSPGCSNK